MSCHWASCYAAMASHGLTQTHNVRGGMMAWHAAGLPEQ